ncbi:MAG: hypothetical protein N2511_07825 [Thermodesulfovibrionales bacterium]|nr:hypothetical protein [Thermodesulfovibrionales bacterium]
MMKDIFQQMKEIQVLVEQNKRDFAIKRSDMVTEAWEKPQRQYNP